jgi:hypothetical protein
MRLRLLLIAVCASISFTVIAQVRYRPTETGPWRPWSFTAIATARQARGATAAEVQAFQARLQALAAIVKGAPGVSPPIGFAGELWGSLAGYDNPGPGQPAGRAVPLAGSLSFGAFPLIEFERGGRLVNEDLKGGETELLQFVVNQLDGSVYGGSRPQGWGAASLDAFVEPEAGAEVAGLPRLGDVFVVRKNPKPLWLPFPLADALQPIVTERRTLYESRRDGYAKEVAEFTSWRTPAKRAARRAEWQKSAASMPKGAEFVATMEKCVPRSASCRRSTGSSRSCRRRTSARRPATTSVRAGSRIASAPTPGRPRRVARWSGRTGTISMRRCRARRRSW